MKQKLLHLTIMFLVFIGNETLNAQFKLKTGYLSAVDFAGGPQIGISFEKQISKNEVYTYFSLSYGVVEKGYRINICLGFPDGLGP